MAFEQFLSAETGPLMAIADLGEFKAHAIERFRGILYTTVKTSLKTDSPIASQPIAESRVKTSLTTVTRRPTKKNLLDSMFVCPKMESVSASTVP